MSIWISLFMLLFSFAVYSAKGQEQNLYRAKDCNVTFLSYAELEIIKASTANVQGVLDMATGKFAFKISINSFDGFNSPQQRLHFQEKFMETNDYPDATFSGKTIETIVLSIDEDQEIRVKGRLTIHGRSVEKLIKVLVSTDGWEIKFKSDFNVLLEEHEIRVPKIVKYNIAEEIAVSVVGRFVKEE